MEDGQKLIITGSSRGTGENSEIRRELHKNPEIGFELPQTKALDFPFVPVRAEGIALL